MDSTQQGHMPGWSPRSTGPLAAMPWGINSATKGRLIAGAFIGDINATTGSIGTAELATGAVTNPKLGSVAVSTTKIALLAITEARLADDAVTDAKRSFTWSTLAGAAAGTGTLPSAVGGFLITVPGTSKGCVFTTTGTRFSVPTAGDSYRFNINSNTGTTVPIFIQSTAATFDGSNKNLRFGENDQFAVIEAVSSTRWAVTSWSTGVSIAATT